MNVGVCSTVEARDPVGVSTAWFGGLTLDPLRQTAILMWI
jgi:hypothetical protein